MTYVARELIADAYALSGFVGRDFQTVTGAQERVGLTLLNECISEKSVDKRIIPYFGSYTLNSVIDQQKYFIPYLVEIESFTFTIGTIRYASKPTSRKDFFATPRAEQISSLPFQWHIERKLGGADLYLYFLPAGIYLLTIWGKFGFASVSLTTDLSLVYETWYTKYLRYELAAAICEDGNTAVPPNVIAKLESMHYNMRDQSPMDAQIRTVPKFGTNMTLGWAFINLGQGWIP